MNVCSAYSPLLSTHVCADYTRRSRAESHLHLLFYTSRRPRCFAAVCWFLLRGCVFRPDDACQKRFSWFPDWSQKVQTCVNLLDLVKSFQTSISLKIWRRYSRARASQCLLKFFQKLENNWKNIGVPPRCARGTRLDAHILRPGA